MPHQRERYLKEGFVKTLNFSPIVGVLGHRQVGKTTLIESIAKKYFTLDDEDTLLAATESPKKFLAELSGTGNALDECQMAPGLFPALKEVVRKNKQPGQFILSGSVRFTSRKAIRESLTGRIINHELLPFTVSELIHAPLSELGLKLASTRITSDDTLATLLPDHLDSNLKIEVDKYFIRGGLPSLCFVRDIQLRQRKIMDQLNTILDRDIRLIYPTSVSYNQLLDFLQELALSEGLPIQFSDIQKKVKLSDVTQKKLIYALESVFLIRKLPIKGGKKNFVIRLEDQAESHFLRSTEKSSTTSLIEWEGLLYRHIRAQFVYKLGIKFDFFHYQTRGGAKVPIAVETSDGTIGFIPMFEAKPNRSELASASSFFSAIPNSKIIYCPLDFKVSPTVLNERSFVIPIKYFL
jgi:predicted AAA+ superfamily ATPase